MQGREIEREREKETERRGFLQLCIVFLSAAVKGSNPKGPGRAGELNLQPPSGPQKIWRAACRALMRARNGFKSRVA